jgi:hypothetical protein
MEPNDGFWRARWGRLLGWELSRELPECSHIRERHDPVEQLSLLLSKVGDLLALV